MEIVWQQQPTPDSCMVTCLAMAVNKNVQEMYDQHHDELYEKRYWLDDVLDCYDVPYFYGHPKKNGLLSGFVYFITVASLNIEGGLHQILVKRDRDGVTTLYDPVKGREGKRYYVYGDSTAPDNVSLITWVIDLIIPIQE